MKHDEPKDRSPNPLDGRLRRALEPPADQVARLRARAVAEARRPRPRRRLVPALWLAGAVAAAVLAVFLRLPGRSVPAPGRGLAAPATRSLTITNAGGVVTVISPSGATYAIPEGD